MNSNTTKTPTVLIDELISMAVGQGASDIHIEHGEREISVRIRIDGFLQDIAKIPGSHKDAIVSRIKILANLDVTEKRRPQDGRIKHTMQDRSIDIRVSTLPTLFGEKVVLRILDQGSFNITLEDIGFVDSSLTKFREVLYLPHGIILVTGPTGSGKTTTLYASLLERISADINITTIEDPVEYYMPGINQTQVQREIGLDFAAVLRSVLRQDPDVIMIGEIRDRETAEIAIRAALTGHLVLATLHTNDSASAIARLIDMGIEPFLVASCVKLVMAQRLIRKICPTCKTPIVTKNMPIEMNGLPENTTLYEGAGCDKCRQTGFRNREALIEILPIADELASAILSKVNSNEIKTIARRHGMITLYEAGMHKVINGITTLPEVIRVSLN